MVERASLADLSGSPHAVPFPDAEPKTVRLELEAGESVPPHDHPGRSIVFHLLDGSLSLELGGNSHELTEGDLVRFDGDQQIAPTATTDATALIVLATD